jgi:hypothetical protein
MLTVNAIVLAVIALSSQDIPGTTWQITTALHKTQAALHQVNALGGVDFRGQSKA